MISQGPSIREHAIESYRYLCRRGARKFLRRGLERGDLEQIAAIGLIKAWDRYDLASQTPFEAYAWLMIVGELMHHVRDFEHMVRLPRWVRRLEKRYAHAQERLMSRLEREPTRREIAEELGIPLAVLQELERARRATASASHAVREGSVSEFDSTAAPVTRPLGVDGLLVETALSALAPLERRIVLGVYGLGMSQTEIARRVGLTARQIYRLHRGALSRMRAALGGTSTTASPMRTSQHT